MIIIFISCDIINSCSGAEIHVIHDPEVIANTLRIIIGRMAFIDLWFHDIGDDLIKDLLDVKDIRREYDAVIPMDRVINVSIIMLRLDDNIFSKIMSFEKNPDMNGTPINANLLTPKIDRIIGKLLKFNPIIRISW